MPAVMSLNESKAKSKVNAVLLQEPVLTNLLVGLYDTSAVCARTLVPDRTCARASAPVNVCSTRNEECAMQQDSSPSQAIQYCYAQIY